MKRKARGAANLDGTVILMSLARIATCFHKADSDHSHWNYMKTANSKAKA